MVDSPQSPQRAEADPGHADDLGADTEMFRKFVDGGEEPSSAARTRAAMLAGGAVLLVLVIVMFLLLQE